MARHSLKHHPQLILLWVARNYMNETEFKALLDDLTSGFKTDGKFLRILLRHFDIERIKQNRIVWQDEWIYNYIVYDCKGTKLPKTQLLIKYEREIAIPAEESFKELRKLVPTS